MCWGRSSALMLSPNYGAMIDMLRTGTRPLPFAETLELMAVIIAGIRSREQGGTVISVPELLAELA